MTFTIRTTDGARCSHCRAPLQPPARPTPGQLWSPICTACLHTPHLEHLKP